MLMSGYSGDSDSDLGWTSCTLDHLIMLLTCTETLRLDAAGDHKCPKCNKPLPQKPSPELKVLLQQLDWDEFGPQTVNRGFGALTGLLVEVCDHHTFEEELLPKARMKGWPESIEWDKIPSQMKALKPRLDRLVRRPSESQWFDVLSPEWQGGARKAQGPAMGMHNMDVIERRPG